MSSSITLRIRHATGLRSLANASQPRRSASRGIEPPPANGSTTSGGSPPCAARTRSRHTARKGSAADHSQAEPCARSCSRAARTRVDAQSPALADRSRHAWARRPASRSAACFTPGLRLRRSAFRSAISNAEPARVSTRSWANSWRRWAAARRNASGQRGSQGSGSSSASSTARLDASGRRAHQRCRVEGCPWRIDFSRAARFDTAAIGKSTSASRWHSRGITTAPRPSGRSLSAVSTASACASMETGCSMPG